MHTRPAAFSGISGLSIELRFRHTMNDVSCRTTHIYAFEGDDLATRTIHMYSSMDIKFLGRSKAEISEPHFFTDGFHLLPRKQLATSVHTTILHGHFSDGLLGKQSLTFTLNRRARNTS